MSLTREQSTAVQSTEGPVLIIAGPGSGKTHTLVERIAHLVLDKHVPPSAILVSTFTDKAARELVSRVSRRLASAGVELNLADMAIGTLHSICLDWLEEFRNKTRLKRSYQVLDQFEQSYLIYRNYDKFRGKDDAKLVVTGQVSAWNVGEQLAARFNQCSEELLEASDLQGDSHPGTAALGRLYQTYLDLLADPKQNALDFSLIQVEAYRLLRDNSEILRELQNRYRYLMIDEYQDTNTVQEALVALLAQVHGNLCVVGDDDQALYRFRGATVRNILEFEQLLPDRQCTVVRLEDNFRSHKDIVGFYADWMDKQDWTGSPRPYRHAKDLRPAAVRPWAGPGVQRVSATGVTRWCEELHAFLVALRDQGALTDWNQVAFLFKSLKHDDVQTLADYLERQGIAVYAPRSRMFFGRPEVQLTVGALLFLFPTAMDLVNTTWPDEDERPDVVKWYEDCLFTFCTVVKPADQTELRKWAKGLRKVHEGLGEPTDYAFAGLFYQLLQFPLWADLLGDSAKGGVKDSRPARNLAIISQLLTRYEHLHGVDLLKPEWLELNLKNLFCKYFRFLFDGGIEEFEDEADYAPSGCVSFLTIHQSKGLEFPVVVVGSLYAGPRSKNDPLQDHLAAEHYRKLPFEPADRIAAFDFWRLYYVAFSRAQNLLVLTDPAKTGPGSNPSKTFRPVCAPLPAWRDHFGRLKTLKLEQIRPPSLQREYSFTGDVAVFETCARQYQVFKELDFAPVRSQAILFGTLVHQTIEDVHRAAMGGRSSDITVASIADWFDDNYRYLSARERKYLAPNTKKAALSHVQRYVCAQQEHGRRHGDVWSRLIEAEVDVSLLRPGYVLSGSIDLLRDAQGGIEVLDFKSERKPDLADPERVQRYKRQLEVYAHLVEERLGKQVSQLTLYYTGEPEGSNPMLTWPVDRTQIGKTVHAFDEVVARIESKQFDQPTRPKRQVCDGCDLRHHCDRRC